MPFTKLMENSGFKELHDGKLFVFMNPSGEVFIERHNGVTVRITDTPNGLIITSPGCVMQPTAYNGCSAFAIEHR